jgi:hypothetical protein
MWIDSSRLYVLKIPPKEIIWYNVWSKGHITVFFKGCMECCKVCAVVEMCWKCPVFCLSVPSKIAALPTLYSENEWFLIMGPIIVFFLHLGIRSSTRSRGRN